VDKDAQGKVQERDLMGVAYVPLTEPGMDPFVGKDEEWQHCLKCFAPHVGITVAAKFIVSIWRCVGDGLLKDTHV